MYAEDSIIPIHGGQPIINVDGYDESPLKEVSPLKVRTYHAVTISIKRKKLNYIIEYDDIIGTITQQSTNHIPLGKKIFFRYI